MSFSPTPQEVTQGASERGEQSQLCQNDQALMVTEQESNVCQSYANLEPAEADVGSQQSDTGLSVWPTDRSIAAKNSAGYVGENANRGFTEAPSSLEQTDHTESSHKNVQYELRMDSGGLHEAHASLRPLDTCSDSLVDSNSYNSAEVAVSPTENRVGLKINVFDGESKPLGQHTSRGVSKTSGAFEEVRLEENFAEQQFPNQGSGVAVVVSTDLDGWQRFDSEENKGSVVFGCDPEIDDKSLVKRELWEQLLEEGSQDGETHFRMSISQAEAETGIDSALYGGNRFWLASPGNPFIEGLDRLSNFSEADHCTANEFIAKSQLLESFEANMGLSFKEGPSHTDHSSENFLQDTLVEGNLGSQSNGLCEHGGSQHAKPRFPSFSDIRRSSSQSKDPSFASFLEQVPAFQAGIVHGIENGGEKWEANFDLMVPVTQEGPRSLSLPREAGDTQGQRQNKTFSLFSREAPVRSQSKPSGFSSPKLSPIVKKVVNKVRTKPEELLNAVRHGKSSSTMDNMQPKKRIWRCCICCSHAN